MVRRCSLLTAILLLAAMAAAQPERPIIKSKDQDREPVSQALPPLKEPPAAVAAETSHLSFQVSPLSSKGLLSQQTRDAIKALMKANRRGTIVKLRAFIAGTGDMRRVQSIVSEMFTDKKQPIPALSIVQVGALPKTGAQVEIESVSAGKNVVDPNGLAFFSGQRASTAPAAVAQLAAAAQTAHISPRDMLRVTCFLGSLSELKAVRQAAAAAFPAAAADFVQAVRFSPEAFAVCEGAARRSGPGDAIAFAGDAALVNTPKLVFSSAQMAFLDRDSDLRLALDRLGKNLAPLGTSYKDVVVANFYPLTRAVAERLSAISSEFFPSNLHPAGASLIFQGLPSLDASMAVEVIAAPRD